MRLAGWGFLSQRLQSVSPKAGDDFSQSLQSVSRRALRLILRLQEFSLECPIGSLLQKCRGAGGRCKQRRKSENLESGDLESGFTAPAKIHRVPQAPGPA